MVDVTRRIFPRRLTYRWFATRGWAFGAAFAFLVAAVWLRPNDLPFDGWMLGTTFGLASVMLTGLALDPENLRWRLMAVAFTVFAALVRSWAILTGTGQAPTSRFAASCMWLFIAYACWLLAMFTAKIPNRGR